MNELKQFLDTHLPQFLHPSDPRKPSLANGIMEPGSLANIVFELGREWHRRERACEEYERNLNAYEQSARR